MHSIDQIISETAQNWKTAGIMSGDIVLIHSNIKRSLLSMRSSGHKIMPGHILKSFIEAVGNEGTLLFPLFNFDFPKTNFFDIKNTPSQMGVLTEAARLHPQSVRTGHPIYSFAVIGKHAPLFKGIDNISGYGSESPFALLRKLNGKIASLDLSDQNSMTFYHHVEEINHVPYRYFKSFSGTYIDLSGKSSNKTYKLFVRDIEKHIVTDVNPAGEMLWQAGLYSGDKPKQNMGLRVINANDIYDFISELIKKGRALGTLYRIEKPINN